MFCRPHAGSTAAASPISTSLPITRVIRRCIWDSRGLLSLDVLLCSCKHQHGPCHHDLLLRDHDLLLLCRCPLPATTARATTTSFYSLTGPTPRRGPGVARRPGRGSASTPAPRQRGGRPPSASTESAPAKRREQKPQRDGEHIGSVHSEVSALTRVWAVPEPRRPAADRAESMTSCLVSGQ